MASGVEWMFEAVLKSLKIDPVQAREQIAQTTQIIVKAGGHLEEIRAQNAEILTHLRALRGIENVGTDVTGERVRTETGGGTAPRLANGHGA